MLAGGRSSRFGSDKALALWRGQPLLDRAIATLAPWCAEVVVVGRDHPGQPRIDDRPHAGLGPLGGIAGALDYAKINGFDSVLTIACDMPEVPGTVLTALVTTVPSYCADAPVLGHWPSDASEGLIARLSPAEPGKPGTRSVRGWAEAIGATPVRSPAPLANVNTPADLTS